MLLLHLQNQHNSLCTHKHKTQSNNPNYAAVKGKKVKSKGQVLDIALLHNEHMLRSALQSRKWQLIGMS